jgi:NAD(P)H-dependent FMN reductase
MNTAQTMAMQNHNVLRVAVIIGSTRPGRFAPTVAGWFREVAARRDDIALDMIDLAETGPPDENPGNGSSSISARLAAADAFVIVTPEYNHSFPAPLKNAIDLHFVEWQAKPVGFVSYGGKAGGLRAVEQLRQVFAELHAVTVRDSVSFHDVWSQFDSNGSVKIPDPYESAAKAMLNQLAWWGNVLREGRTSNPYGF